jgi:hypothetical protein
VAATGIEHAVAIDREDVLRPQPERDQHVQAGDAGGTGATGREPHFADLLADDLQCVEHGRSDDDRGPVLVVVEHRDLHPLAQLALDDEALRRLDVLEVDAAEGRLERGDDVDQLVGIVLVDLDVEHIDAGELLEQHALAFHHRLAGERADVAEAEHGGAVRDHRDQIAARGHLAGRGRIGHDRFAGMRDTR